VIELSRLAPGQPALDELAGFVAELNRDEAQQIGYLDSEPAQVAASLIEHGAVPHESWVVGREQGRLVGAFGFEADTELGRAWLFGPFVRHSAWAATADRLWAALQPLLPGGLREHELFYNTKNANCLAFAERHGFPLHGDSAILRFGRDALASLPEAQAQELQPSQHAAFEALHAQTFPNTYYSGPQMLGFIDEHHKVFVLAEGDVLLGYAYIVVRPTFGEATVEFIGVDEQMRGRGFGARLLVASLRWMFSFPGVHESFLTTGAENRAAIGLYSKAGFQQLHTMRAFRKTL
jgi:ribosomal protein S18 acetylase RimI-like enzyme